MVDHFDPETYRLGFIRLDGGLERFSEWRIESSALGG